MLKSELQMPADDLYKAYDSSGQPYMPYAGTRQLDEDVEYFVMKYRSRLYAYAYRLLRDYDEAEELVQQTWVTLWKHLAKNGRTWTSPLDEWRWLCLVLYNAILNYVKRESRLISLDTSEGSRLLQVKASPFEQPDLVATRRVLLWEVHGIMEDMPAHYREVVILRFLYGYSLQEIAKKLHCPLGTVKCYLHRGLKYLHDKFADKGITPKDLALWADAETAFAFVIFCR